MPRTSAPRQFTRLFRMETGTTPAKAVEMLRVEAAETKLMLEQSRLPIEQIAREVGFDSRERMRLAFTRVHGEVPRAIRSDAGRSPRCEAAAMAAGFSGRRQASRMSPRSIDTTSGVRLKPAVPLRA